MVTANKQEFITNSITLIDYSADPLFNGSPILLYVKNIDNAFIEQIASKAAPFQSTDFVASDNESLITKNIRHKGNIQFNSYENDIWKIDGDFVHQLGSSIEFETFDNFTGSAIIFSPYVLKVLKMFPRTLHLSGSVFDELMQDYGTAHKPIYSGSGIPVVIKSGSWKIPVKREESRGMFTLTMLEDKE